MNQRSRPALLENIFKEKDHSVSIDCRGPSSDEFVFMGPFVNIGSFALRKAFEGAADFSDLF
jgi:hypothetical protein